MSEIIHFPLERRITAIGRFFITSIIQQEEIEEERVGSVPQAAVDEKPSDERIMLAERELKFIFFGENAEEAERLYLKGLSDIVSRRSDTLEAIFYSHVQQLTDIANHRFDKLT